jgi:Uma2 family endonuclease
MQMFARYHVPEYWIVDPQARTVEIYELAGPAYELRSISGAADSVTSPTIEGLTCAAAALFAS